ncbi:hypothetical protein [Megasphaera elsdenii]|uniref:hypothetical protein n=1 Tax=Megasphaera elsdenii TaxID=907 RepID=UPI0022E819DE|nr:hypothetical protein [Megasphaera elsdenii]
MGFFDAFFKEHQRTKSEEIYDKALQIFNSPELQNQALSGKLADKVTHGEDCDIIPGSYGRFGHDRTNPIPVNGPSGEFVYLSRLRLRRTGSMVFFHKAGSVDGIDVFELTNVSGKFVDRLYVDMYHPRCSRRYPEGYTLEKEAVFPRGVTTNLPDFPKGLYKAIKKEAKQRLGIDVADKESDCIDVLAVQEALARLRKERPVAPVMKPLK